MVNPMAELAWVFHVLTAAMWEWLWWVAVFYAVLAVVVFLVSEWD
jgi:hypothetical protein